MRYPVARMKVGRFLSSRSVVTPAINSVYPLNNRYSSTLYGRGDIHVCPGFRPKGVCNRFIAVLLTPRSPGELLSFSSVVKKNTVSLPRAAKPNFKPRVGEWM